MFKPRIGTITACYNAGKYFHNCLNGLLAQELRPSFITVIDDCSTDDSVEIIRYEIETAGGGIKAETDQVLTAEIGLKDRSEIKVFKNKINKGPAGARNTGLKYLLDKTDVICIADCDDFLYPNKISRSVEIMNKYSHLAIVYSDYDTYNTKTEEIKREFKEPFSSKRLAEECIVSNNSLIATSIFNIVGFYDETLRGPEDYDMWLRISQAAAIYHVPESLYQYNITGENITITTPPEKFAEQVWRLKQKMVQKNVQ